MTDDDIARQVEANIEEAETNSILIEAKLALVKASRWRLARNRRLLDDCWRLLHANDNLFAANWLLIKQRQQQIDALSQRRARK